MMTVGELINILESYPDDVPVILGYTGVQDVHYEEDYYFADAKNPKQAFGPAVIIE